MKQARLMMARYATSIFIVGSIASAQPSPGIDALLKDLASPELRTRRDAFVRLMQNSRGSHGVSNNLLRAGPDLPEQVKIALIATLEVETALNEEMITDGTGRTEELLEYSAELTMAVAALRDPRSAKGLLRAAMTIGAGARDGLADICPAATDVLIEASKNSFLRYVPFRVMGDCLKRPASLREHPSVATKLRGAPMAGLDDPDWIIRDSAAYALYPLRTDTEVRAKLQLLAGMDSYVSSTELTKEGLGRFMVREKAARALTSIPEVNFYVMRTPDTRQCRIQSADEQPIGETFIGPDERISVTDSMCSHVDTAAKDPSMCWFVVPQNVCRTVGR